MHFHVRLNFYVRHISQNKNDHLSFFKCTRTVFYPAISLKSLSLWNCTRVGNNYYLTSDLRLLCSGPSYTAASAFNAIFLLVFVIGWPAFMLWYDSDFYWSLQCILYIFNLIHLFFEFMSGICGVSETTLS